MLSTNKVATRWFLMKSVPYSSTAGPGYTLVSSQPTSISWTNRLTLLWEIRSPRPHRLRRTFSESEAFPFQCHKFTGDLAVWTWRVFVELRLPFPVCGGISWRATWPKFSCLQMTTGGRHILTGPQIKCQKSGMSQQVILGSSSGITIRGCCQTWPQTRN